MRGSAAVPSKPCCLSMQGDRGSSRVLVPAMEDSTSVIDRILFMHWGSSACRMKHPLGNASGRPELQSGLHFPSQACSHQTFYSCNYRKRGPDRLLGLEGIHGAMIW